MKKTAQKFLSILLSVCMVCSMLPMSVLAEEGPAPDSYQVVLAVAGQGEGDSIAITDPRESYAPGATVELAFTVGGDGLTIYDPLFAPNDFDSDDTWSYTVDAAHANEDGVITLNAQFVHGGTQGEVLASAVYVSSGGSDGNDGSSDFPFATLAKAYSAVNSGGTIYVKTNLTSANVSFSDAKTVTITSATTSPVTITRSSGDGPFININHSSSNVTIKNIVLDGGYKNATPITSSGPLIKVSTDVLSGGTSGSVTLGDGAILQNNHNDTKTNWGGGLYVTGNGRATIQAGAVIQNNTAQYGGGIHANQSSTLVMTGGTITGNIATDSGSGGGISLNRVTTFTMSGNVKIYGNYLTAAGSPRIQRNIYIYEGQKITIGGDMGKEADVYVCTKGDPSKGDVQFTSGGSVNDTKYFHSDLSSSYGVLYKSGSDSGLYFSVSMASADVLIWTPKLNSQSDDFNKFVTALAGIYTAAGKTVVTRASTTDSDHFTGQETLANQYDLVVIPGPQEALNITDIARLKEFLAAGGRIVMVGENGSFATCNTNLSNAAMSLGASFTIGGSTSATGVSSTANEKSALAKGITGIKANAACNITYSLPAQWVIRSVETSPTTWCVDQAADKGRITALSDVNWLINYTSEAATNEQLVAAKKFALNWLTDSVTNMQTVSTGGNPNAGFGLPENITQGTAVACTDKSAVLVFKSIATEFPAKKYTLTGYKLNGGEKTASVASVGGTWQLQVDGLTPDTSYTLIPYFKDANNTVIAGNEVEFKAQPTNQSGTTGSLLFELKGSNSFTLNGANGLRTTYNDQNWAFAPEESVPTITVLPYVDNTGVGTMQVVVRNNTAASASVNFGWNADVMIGANDRAPIKRMPGVGLYMTDGTNTFVINHENNDGNSRNTVYSSYSAANWGTTDTSVTTSWYGYFSSRGSYLYSNGADNSTNYDSGATFSYNVTGLQSGETRVYTFKVAAGGADTNAVTSLLKGPVVTNVTLTKNNEGSFTFSVPGAGNYTITDGAGAALPAASLPGGIASDTAAQNLAKGSYTITGLKPGQTVVVTPENTNISPLSVTIPAVSNNLTAGIDGTNAYFTISPSVAGQQYVVIDPVTNKVAAFGTSAGGGALKLAGLTAGKEYLIDLNSASVSVGTSVTPSEAKVPASTPAEGFLDVTADNASRADGSPAGKDKIVITNTKSTQEYAVVNSETGELATTGWVKGNDDTLTFDGLDPAVDYTVVTRTPASATKPASQPSLGVSLPANTVKATDLSNGSNAGGKSTITVATKANTKYAVVDSTGKVVAPVSVVGSTVADKDGWVTGDGTNPITFDGLTPGESYRVVSLDEKTGDTDPTDGGNDEGTLYPTNPSGVVGPKVQLPTVTSDQLTAELVDGSPKTVTITIDPADEDMVYGLVTSTGAEVDDGLGAWKSVVDGKVKFTGLDADTTYKVVAKLSSDTTTATTAKAATGTPITTPPETFENVTPAGIERENGTSGDKIVVGTPVAGQEYTVIDKATGKIVTATVTGGSDSDGDGWYTAGSDPLTFDNLPAGGDYEIVTRAPGAVAGPGVDVPAITVKPSQVGDTGKDPNGKATITVSGTSADVKYAVVDQATGKVVSPAKNADGSERDSDGWLTGTGGELTFHGLNPGAQYQIVSLDKVTEGSKTDADGTALGNTLANSPYPQIPGAVVGPVKTVPAVDASQLSAAIVGDSTKTATLTIDPADKDMVYGLVDKDGNAVTPLGDWKEVENGKVEFTGLPAGATGGEYKVVAKPKTGDDSATTAKATAGTAIKTPSANYTDVTASGIRLEDGTEDTSKNKIVITSAKTGQLYAIVDGDGNVVTGLTVSGSSANTDGWATANGGTLSFDGLDPNGSYQVVTCEPGAVPGLGVSVPAGTVKPTQVDTDIKDDGGSALVKVNTQEGYKYALVDEDGNVVAPAYNYSGTATTPVTDPDSVKDNDGWLTGGEGEELAFGNLTPGKKYQVVSTPIDSENDTDNAGSGGNAAGSGVYPIEMKDVVGPTVKLPTVGAAQLTGAVVNDAADLNNGKATITIQPSCPTLSYAVVDSATHKVVTTATAPENNGWLIGSTEDPLVFNGLDPNKTYEVIVVDKNTGETLRPGYNNADVPAGTGTTIATPTPAVTAEVIDRDRVHGENGNSDTLTINPTAGTIEYAIIDRTTGLMVAPVTVDKTPGTPSEGTISDTDGWVAGNGSDVVFHGLDVYKEYEIITRPCISSDNGNAGAIPVENSNTTTVKKAGSFDVSGIVKDSGGTAVPNATVKVTVATLDDLYATYTTTTDGEGKYTLSGNNANLKGTYAIYVDGGPAGVETQSVQFLKTGGVAPSGGTADITVATNASGNTNIAGGVVSSYGAPVSGATITLIDKATGLTVDISANSGTTITTTGGGYTLENLPNGTYIVQTDKAGKSGLTEIKVENGKISANTAGGYRNTNLAVTPGAILTGQVEGLSAGQSATVSLNVPVYAADGTDVIGSKTVTAVAEGPNGHWRIAGVPNGSYPVTVTTPNGAVTGTIDVTGGALDSVTPGENLGSGGIAKTDGKLMITAPAAAEKPAKPNVITGAVVNEDNEPLVGATLIVYNDKGVKVGETTTGTGGGYTLPNALPAGTYYLSADGDSGSKNGLTGPITIDGSGKVTGKTAVTVDSSASKLLTGTVTRSNDAPAANATVVVKDSSGAVLAVTRTNSSGQYFVGAVPAGATVTITTADGETVSFTTDNGDLTDDGAFDGSTQTRQPGSEALTVIGPSGALLPVTTAAVGHTDPGAHIAVTGPDGETPANDQFTISDAGKLTVKSTTPAGVYTVTLTKSGMEEIHQITVADNGEGGRVIVSGSSLIIPAATVTGTISYQSTGAAPRGATLTIPGWGSTAVNTSTGSYTLAGIPDGEYEAELAITEGGATSTIKVGLTITDGVVTYAEQGTAVESGDSAGANVRSSESNLTITPSTKVAGITTALTTAQEAATEAIEEKSDDKLAAAIQAIKDAKTELTTASEEERRQIAPGAVQQLSNTLDTLVQEQPALELNIEANVDVDTAAVSALAVGIRNPDQVKSDLEGQQALLVDDEEMTKAAESNKKVDVTVTFKAEDVTDDLTPGANKDMPQIEAVATARGVEQTAIVEIVVEKTTVITETVSAEITSTVSTTSTITQLAVPVTLRLSIPENLRGYKYYGVLRAHDGTVTNLPSWVLDDTIEFSSAYYSTYAILASNDPIFADDQAAMTTPVILPADTRVTVSIEPTAHGTITVDKPTAKTGETVTITATPDPGYELGELTVTDANGNNIVLTPLDDGRFTFTQAVDQPVTVTGTFVRSADAPGYADCPKDATCPLYGLSDVNALGWYHDGIHYCIENGIMEGTSATAFSPNMSTTRGMIVTILYRLEGSPLVEQAASYGDVPAGKYYADPVAWASANAIVEGYGDGTFGPDHPVTREQLTAILYRYAQYKGYDVTARGDLSAFPDMEQLHDYAVEPMAWANAQGLVTGLDTGLLDPRGKATRAQAATILLRFTLSLTED